MQPHWLGVAALGLGSLGLCSPPAGSPGQPPETTECRALGRPCADPSPFQSLPACGFLPSAPFPEQFSQRKSPESTSGGLECVVPPQSQGTDTPRHPGTLSKHLEPLSSVAGGPACPRASLMPFAARLASAAPRSKVFLAGAASAPAAALPASPAEQIREQRGNNRGLSYFWLPGAPQRQHDFLINKIPLH